MSRRPLRKASELTEEFLRDPEYRAIHDEVAAQEGEQGDVTTDREALCPTCFGLDTISDPLTGEVDPYTCPDCGGSGRAEDSMTPADREALKRRYSPRTVEFADAEYNYSQGGDPEVLSLLAELEAAEATVHELTDTGNGETLLTHLREIQAERDQLRGEVKRLRDLLDSLAGRAENAAEYLRHGIDPTNESDLHEFWLASEAEDARRALVEEVPT